MSQINEQLIKFWKVGLGSLVRFIFSVRAIDSPVVDWCEK